MDNNTSKKLWEDYLVVGAVVAILLVMIGSPHATVYQMIPAAVFMLITGIKGNLKTLLNLVTKNWYILPVFAALCGYSLYSGNMERLGFFVTGFALCFAGKCVAENCKDIRVPLLKLGIMFAVIFFVAAVKALKGGDISSFMTGTLRPSVIFVMWSLIGIALEKVPGYWETKKGIV